MPIATEKAGIGEPGTATGLAPWTCCDLVSDNGAYLAWAIAFNSRVVGLAIGDDTGYVPFRAVPQVQAQSVAHWLLLRRDHFWPLIGRCFRRRWAKRIGVGPKPPDWRLQI